jgi:hypothetical protein
MQIFLPLITPQDYETFRQILKHHIPANYDAWRDLFAQWQAHHEEKGDSVREIKVTPDKFADYLSHTAKPPDLNHLLAFTEQCADEARTVRR